MSDPALLALWQRHCEGPALNQTERDTLAAALQADAAFRRECFADAALHDDLLMRGRSAADADHFITSVLHQCQFVGGSARFAQQVRERIDADEESGEPPAASSPASRSHTRRRGSTRIVRRRRSSKVPALLWPLLAAGLLIAILVPVFARPSALALRGWTVLDVTGTPRSEGSATLAVGDVLFAGAVVIGAPGDSLRLDGDSLMTVELSAARAVVPSLTSPQWRLDRGVLTAEVASRAGREVFQVITPHAIAEVVGTRFTVDVTERSRLAVEHGVVRFGGPGAWQEVRAGGEAVLPAPVAPEPKPSPAPAVIANPNAAQATVVASYDFRAGAGTVVVDRSGHGLDLDIGNAQAVRWVGDGLELRSETHLLAHGNCAPLVAACVAAGGFSFAVDVTIPEQNAFPTIKDGPARIVTLSDSTRQRNVTLGWGEIGLRETALVLRVHQGASSDNGTPTSWIPAPPAGRSHVVVTYQTGVGARWYVDGQAVTANTWDSARKRAVPAISGALDVWSPTARLALGGEVIPDAIDGGLRPFVGTYHRVECYAGALDADTALRVSAP